MLWLNSDIQKKTKKSKFNLNQPVRNHHTRDVKTFITHSQQRSIHMNCVDIINLGVVIILLIYWLKIKPANHLQRERKTEMFVHRMFVALINTHHYKPSPPTTCQSTLDIIYNIHIYTHSRDNTSHSEKYILDRCIDIYNIICYIVNN